MKNKLFLIILLLLSIFSFKGVDAKVSGVYIKNVELMDKTGLTQEVSSATFEGMNINYNVNFKQEGDSISYKVTIYNKGIEDIYINNKGTIDGSPYIVYDYSWDNNENVIKGYSEKTFGITIKYNKEIEESNKYKETKNLVIKISDQKGNVLPAKNPKTDSNLSIFIILLSIEILAVMAVTIYLIKNKKLNIRNLKQMKKTNMVTAGVFLMLVLGTIIGYSYALEAAEIKLESIVTISKSRLARSCYSDSYTKDHYEELTARTINISNDYCNDWDELIPLENDASLISTYSAAEPLFNLITTKSKTMESLYNWNNEQYRLLYTKDVSDMQDGNVMLGVYQSDANNILAVIGQDGGVLAPIDSSWLFGNYAEIDPDNNIHESMISTASMEIPQAQQISYDDYSVFSPEKVPLNNIKNIDTNIMAYTSTLNVENLDMSDTNDVSGTFAGATLKIEEGDISNWDLSKVERMPMMFMDAFNNVEEFDMSNWNTSNVTNMLAVFDNGFNNAKTINISNWNTSKVENMDGLFQYGLNKVEKLDLSKWDTSSVKNMEGLFYAALNEATEVNISTWDTSKVENMYLMFCYGLQSVDKLDLSNWDVSNVYDMEYIFAESLYSASSLNLSNWNIKNTEYIGLMFYDAFGYAERTDLYLNNIDFITFSNNYPYSYYNMFYKNPSNLKIHVSDNETKEWILSLNSNYRPSSWNENNIIID